MKQVRLFALGLAFAALAGGALAAPRTVTLHVSRMVCPACQQAVKKALLGVEGVPKADVNPESKQAIVTFDDAKASEEALLKATGRAGFPSAVKTGDTK